MKVSNRLLLIVFGLIIQQTALSQVIKIGVSTSGIPSISVNDKVLKNRVMEIVQYNKGNTLTFDFTAINDTNAIFTIKGGIDGQSNATEVSLNRKTFDIARIISTDEKLNITDKKIKYSLLKPFNIILGSTSNRDAIMEVTIIPQQINTQPAAGVGATGTSGPVVVVSQPSPKEDVEEKEPEHIPGSAVYDALKLADDQHLSEEEFTKIIKFYFPDPKDDASDITKAKALAKNCAFLNGVDFNPLKAGEAKSQSGNALLSNLSMSSIAGLDVTNFADGLAKFLVKRAKQELSIAFFEKFNEAIDKTPDLKTLFPQTTRLLKSAGEQAYDYEKYIQNLREAFKDDINELYVNLPGIVPNHEEFFKKHVYLKASLLTGCYVARELSNNTHPGDILANYPFEYLDGVKQESVKGAIQTIQLLSMSLRDTVTTPDGNYWVNAGKMRELVNNRKAFRIYLGLVYREMIVTYEDIQFDGTALKAILEAASKDYDKGLAIYDAYKRYILQLGDKVHALNKMIKDYEKPASDSLALEQYAKYFKSSVDLLEYSVKAGDLPGIKGHFPVIDGNVVNLKTLLQKYFDVAYAVTDLTTDINRRNYAAAISQVINIYQIVKVEPAKEDQAEAEKAAKDDISKKEAEEKKTEATESNNTLGKIVKYGSFMAAVATAKNSDEVASAIESAALPVGSARIKRETAFNVSLNAYAGLFLGNEMIRGVDEFKPFRKFNNYGVTAPLGISVSRGHSIFFIGTGEDGWKNGKCGWSTSLFLSLIDVGALAAFRFKDDKTGQIPRIELKDIFSPGAFISLGIPKSPLSFNFGAQMGPNLRKVYNDDESKPATDFSNNIYWRFSTSICVDIPVFNFYTKQK